MSVIVQCRACGGPISVDSISCPRCGQPSALKPPPGRKFLVAAIILLGGGVSLYGIYNTFHRVHDAREEGRREAAELAASLGLPALSNTPAPSRAR